MKEQILQELKELNITENSLSDTELDHRRADALLCMLLIHLGHKDVVEEFEKLNKWYA
jgi:hypothetical protein